MNYELVSITTFDGTEYTMQDGTDRLVLSTPGEMGLPPINFITQKGYKQDGVSELGFRLEPRTITVNFRHEGCSRDQYWQIRNDILNIVRPNRNGQMTFKIVTSEGDVRALKVRSSNPTFPDIGAEVNDEFGFTEIFNFLAFDPVFFDPTETTGGTADQDIDELTFPITFEPGISITFDTDEAFGAITNTYQGNWYTYPKFLITGPFTSFILTHTTTLAAITYTRSVLVNESVTMDLDAGTIIDQDGNDVFGFLSADSDLQGFKIEPDPIVPNGVNTISFQIFGALNNETTITMTLTDRYIGI